MNNLGILYKYELKKLLQRKIVWVAMILMLISTVFTCMSKIMGSYSYNGKKIDTNYHQMVVDKAYERKLSGRMIDQALLEETMEAYKKMPLGDEPYVLTAEYQKYARPYTGIFNFVRLAGGMNTSQTLKWVPNEQELYQFRREMVESSWKENNLSQKEKDFWAKQEAKITTPYQFQYRDSYQLMIMATNTMGIIGLVILSVCLSSIFTDEHTRKTDQIIAGCKNGRHQTYKAKILAGVSFTFVFWLVNVLITYLLSILIFGTDGFHANLQLFYSESSVPISIGTAVIIGFLSVGIGFVVTGTFVMMLSELLHSNIGALSITVGITILSMLIRIPSQYRFLQQAWSYLPSNFAGIWNMFNPQTVTIGNLHLMSYQAVPILYTLFTIVFVLIGRKVFLHNQVNVK